MASFDLYSLFLLSFPLFFAAFQSSGAASGLCDGSCGNQVIRFPFKLNSQPDRCGYPEFDLVCNDGQTILSLPFSGEFTVGNIDYAGQTIWIDDPDNCVPKRLLNNSFTVAGSPFQDFFPQNLTFFNCSSSNDALNGPGAVDCLSNENFTVVVIPTDFYSSGSMQGCSEIATVVAPVWSDPNLGIMLTWAEPDCRHCVKKGGNCQIANNTGLEIGCSGGSGYGLSKGVKYGLVFGLGVPFLFIVAVTITLRDKISGRSNQPRGSTSSSIVLGGYPLKGLDGRTIESYPVTVLGGSRRLPKPDNSTCSICLSEYEAKETLRTIPECQHYFHANCLDEWLRLNGTCPLCRNTP